MKSDVKYNKLVMLYPWIGYATSTHIFIYITFETFLGFKVPPFTP